MVNKDYETVVGLEVHSELSTCLLYTSDAADD